MLCTNHRALTTSILEKIRVQAIARKAIRTRQNFQEIHNTLLKDNYFQAKKAIFDDEGIEQLIKHTLIEAIDIENRHRQAKY